MTVDFEILLIGLPMLVALLCWNALRRNRGSSQARSEDWDCNQESGLRCISTLIPQIQQLRSTRAEMALHRPRHTGYHNQLIATVRATILSQPYFQNSINQPVDKSPDGHQPS